MDETTVYIGVDPTAGRRSLAVAVLGADLRIRALRSTTFEGVVEIALSYPRAVCGVDAPIGPNTGLLSDPAYRADVGLDPMAARYRAFRVGEYELRRRGIFIYNTPVDAANLPGWMREGRRLYDRLRAGGYAAYPEEGPRRMFETYPYAIFTVLAGTAPYTKQSLEGLLQRQLILYEAGIDVPDPMRSLEEMTRYRLKTARVNFDGVLSHDELDALAAAYTAYVLDREPDRVTAVGDPAEGYILVPAPALLDSY
jgi:predicted nuclease with RNAse H fold